MDRIAKFIIKLMPKERKRVREAYEAIIKNQLNDLDIKPMKGKKGWFRCRIGNVRITFVRIQPGIHVIEDVNWRDRVYKK